MSWQPIETAPKDGTVFLAWDGTQIGAAFWFQSSVGSHGWVTRTLPNAYAVTGTLDKPTHWMPLPEPPK